MKNKRVKQKKKKNILVIFIRNLCKLIDKSIVVPVTKFFVMISEKFNKRTGGLERWLVRKNTLVFISLIIAIAFFFYVDSRSSVSLAEVLREQKVIATYNKEAYVVEGLPEVADVTLIGRRVDLYLAKQLSTGNVTVDISNLKPGTHEVNLHYETSINTVDYSLNPSTVTVIIYPKVSATRTATIDVINQDKLDSKFSIQDVTLDQNEIIIKGAEHTLNKVATVKALVDINDIVVSKEEITNGITKLDVNLVAYDSKGNVVDVEMVPSKISANVSISSPSTTVPIKVIPKGDVEFGKAISSINTSVSTVTVYGEESVISSIQYVPVEIDVTNLSETKTYNVIIEKPNGIRDISETTINVTVSLGKVTEKTISNVKIDTINLDPNYSVQSLGKESSVISVIVKGTEEVIANIDASMISATVDLYDLGEGEHPVNVVVTGEELKATYTAKPTKITVKIFKK